MIRRWMSGWRQWFNGKHERGANALPFGERRVWVRYPCQLATAWQPDHTPDTLQLSAKVQNVSRGGINLIVDRELEPGRQLLIELPGTDSLPTAIVMANLVRVTPHKNGEWVIGCTFASELTQDDLEAFGGRLIRPEMPDKRAWVRFATDAEANYQILRNGNMEHISCRAVDISAGGIALEVGKLVDVGAVLSVELRAPNRKLTLSLLACVVRVQVRGDNHWLLGCNFVRELTDRELQSWLVASTVPAEVVRS